MRSVYRPLPRGHQRTDVLRNDRELFVDNGQTRCYMGGRSAVGTSRSCSPPAEQGELGVQWPRARGALRYKGVSQFTGHHLRVGPYLRQRQTLVVFWLLLLFAHTFHHHLLFSDCKENSQS